MTWSIVARDPDSGAFGVIDKPFDISVLPPLIAEALAA